MFSYYASSFLWLLPQIAAMIHYFRTRPEGYWFWIILFFGPIGAVIYFLAVVVFARGGGVDEKVAAGLRERKRIKILQAKKDVGEALPYDYFELGEIQYRMGRYAQAAENLHEAVSRTQDNKEPRYFLGLALEKLGQYVDAGKELEKLLVEDPRYKFGEAMLALARCYQNAGEEKAAIDAYHRVLGQSSFGQARYNLAILLAKQGPEGRQEAKVHLTSIIRDFETSDLPPFQRRAELQWVKKARAMLQQL